MGGQQVFLILGEAGDARSWLGDAEVIIASTTAEASEVVAKSPHLIGLIVGLDRDSNDLDPRMELLRDARWRHPRLPALVVGDGSKAELHVSTRALGARYTVRSALAEAMPAFREWCLREQARHASAVHRKVDPDAEPRSSGVYVRGSVMAEVKRRAGGS